VDATDYAIYRNLTRDGLSRFWASRRLVDPRVSARELAEKVGLSEAGVRVRLRNLRERGLLRGTEVSLNPSLFDSQVVVAEVPVPDPRASEQLFRDLAMVDGVVFARDLLDEDARKVFVYLISDTPGALARRVGLLRRLAPDRALVGPVPYWIPPCERPPTGLDWKLLQAIRSAPDETLAGIATASGISLKTTARRYDLLIDSHACWWSHSSDSQEWPLALLRVLLRPGVDPIAVAHDLLARVENWLPVAEDGLGSEPGKSAGFLAGLVPAEAPAALERVVRSVLALDGVESVQRSFGLGSAMFPQWADERIAKILGPRN
jgi:DNA-binding Lrp family transcriptional regulator